MKDQPAEHVEAVEITRFLAAWLNMRQLIQAANFNHFHKAGLSATQFIILNILSGTGESMTIGELARRINLKPATVAKTVDTLESRKMLARERSPNDGRLVLVKITPAGRKLQNSSSGLFRDYIAGIFRQVPSVDRAALIAGLESLVRAGERQNGGSESPATRDANASPQVKRSSRQSPKL